VNNTSSGKLQIQALAINPCPPASQTLPETQNTESLPREYALKQNSPNPFNPSTLIAYELPKQSFVTIRVYDILGQEVVTLINELQEAGYKTVRFDAGNFASGVYFYQLKAGSFTSVKKMLLMK
jgi:hypothetical protein